VLLTEGGCGFVDVCAVLFRLIFICFARSFAFSFALRLVPKLGSEGLSLGILLVEADPFYLIRGLGRFITRSSCVVGSWASGLGVTGFWHSLIHGGSAGVAG